MIGAMMIFKQLFLMIWQVLDLLFFIAGAIAINCFGFYFGQEGGYLTLFLTFISAGLLVEQVDHNSGGGDA
ncbi:DUF1056 family protein [Weissella minor]|uniref:DUF1056 family protein n=1 Tax=Weissella minor TaxID=1620 RepID=UPI001BAFBBA5|nr:DUF1056 family protein [Weissella minor]MBS0950046.1 DUF1056 family protein [Weissella minor]